MSRILFYNTENKSELTLSKLAAVGATRTKMAGAVVLAAMSIDLEFLGRLI